MLLIQNRGVAPTEAYTLLGASETRNCGVKGAIGLFGTGAKHAINVLLRARLGVIVYCGKTRLTFGTRDVTVGSKEQKIVTVTIGNAKPKDLGWVLDFGATDWREVGMALREFISNAIDRTLLAGETVNEAKESGDLRIEFTETCRAADGFTRVYITDTPDVADYVQNLEDYFLHFRGLENDRILPKHDNSRCRLYREGVFVCEVGQENALCDYNLPASAIAIDECRNLNQYTAMAAIAKLYREASAKDVARVLHAFTEGRQVFEHKLDAYWLSCTYSKDAEQAQRWQEAWGMVHGKKIMATEDQKDLVTLAARKGHAVAVMPTGGWASTVKDLGTTSLKDVLGTAEVDGISETEPTEAACKAAAWAWNLLADEGLSAGKVPPSLRGFEQVCKATGDIYGAQYDNTILLRNDLEGDMLLQTALEEITHYITGAKDNSREIQEFAFRLAVKLAK